MLPTWDHITGWVGQAVVVVAAVLTGRASVKGHRVEVTASPYEALASRIVTLEAQVGELRAKVEHLEDERDDLLDTVSRLRRERNEARDIARDLWRQHPEGTIPPLPVWLEGIPAPCAH